MKKIYVNPAIEVLLVESADLMQMSVYTDEVEGKDVLSRELFNDAVFDEK